MTSASQIKITSFHAAIFDMDGVVTRTASVHAGAWKKMFDDFLKNYYQGHNQPFREFDIEYDYNNYVDGLPRQDGVRKFLASRGIELSEGNENDSEEKETIFGLGRRKNRYFNQVLDREGVEVFPDWLEKTEKWRRAGLKTAIVSSSRNCQAVIDRAKIEHMFDVRVDGEVSRQQGLQGKPKPDIFLEAARRLSVPAAEAVVFEDAISGVQAGRAGNFGLVVGVARHANQADLIRYGADIAVADLTELKSS